MEMRRKRIVKPLIGACKAKRVPLKVKCPR